MGGRGGASGGIGIGAKSAYETKLRENFKTTDYGGKTIAKVGSSFLAINQSQEKTAII